VKRDIAERHDIWEYVDPSRSTDELPQLEHEKPKQKPLWKFKRTQLSAEEREDIDIEDLTDQELSAYKTWKEEYKSEAAVWQRKQNAVKDLNIEIIRTVETKHLSLIINCRDPYSRLTTLKKHFSLSVGERDRQLRNRYLAVCARLKKASVETWLDEWVTVTRLLQEAKLPEVYNNRAQEDFIMSTKGLDDSWSVARMQELIRQDEKGEQYTTIADLIAEYRSYYRRTRPVTSSLSTFATLGITQSKDSEAAPLQRRSITCLCGDNHKFEDCPYVNSSLQQPTWTLDKAVEKKFSKLR
jgi:phosphopantetheinyl transferase (holo-ACP synthase)